MGISERKEREKEQRRKDIIDSAEKVFFEKGLNNSTMDEVAKQAELSKGTLYLYFKSKEEIHFEIRKKAIYKMLRTYLQSGMLLSSLAPKFKDRGGRNTDRIIDGKELKNMKKIIMKYYFSGHCYNIKQTYREMVEELYPNETDADNIPSYDRLKRLISKMKKTNFK